MLVGYARVSTSDQDPALQLDALKRAGCDRVYTETASGAQRDRPELKAALDYMRSGDTLVVWRLDRLARSMRQLIETVEDLEDREVAFRSLTESIDTNTSGGKLVFHGNLSDDEQLAAEIRRIVAHQRQHIRGFILQHWRSLDQTGHS